MIKAEPQYSINELKLRTYLETLKKTSSAIVEDFDKEPIKWGAEDVIRAREALSIATDCLKILDGFGV